MRKLLALLIIGLFAFGAFAGCVGSENEDTGDAGNEDATPDIPEEDENETIERGELKTMRMEWDAKFGTSIDGIETQEPGEGYIFTMPKNAVKITITATASSSAPTEGMWWNAIYLDNPAGKTIASQQGEMGEDPSVTLIFSNEGKLATQGNWEVRLECGVLVVSYDPVMHAVMDVEYYG
ncbi:MAG: hypothetical protein CVT48_02285 [Thermoplasmata archaeon HGW-Thermoplasmata-1]|nr:MAG: hypothetical protein CVT48_02285 [Thermoplasmata archaeon HGW-Thermoplasmata-1]